MSCFRPWILAAAGLLSAAAPTRHDPESLRADFDHLYRGLEAAHFDLYAHRSRSQYDAEYRRVRAELTRPLTADQARVRFQRFAAYGRVAHATFADVSKAFLLFLERGGRSWSVDVRLDRGEVYVARAHAGLERGDRLVTLDGEPIGEVRARLAAHVSADNDRLADSLLERAFPLLVWLEYGERSRFVLEVERAGGVRKTHDVAAQTRAEARTSSGSQSGFQLDPMERVAQVLPGGIAYLRPGPFIELERGDAGMYDNRDFVKFVDGAFQRFLAERCHVLIVDLRNNPGGDHSFSDPMISWFADQPFAFAKRFEVRSSPQAAASNRARLEANPSLRGGISGVLAQRYEETPPGETFEIALPPAAPRKGRRFTGSVYALIDRYSYSNAVNVAAVIQDYGFGTVVGEKTADLATTFGAMESFRLPHTGLQVHFPKARIVRPSGALEPDGVTPDLPIPSPRFPTRDVVLEKLLARIRSRP